MADNKRSYNKLGHEKELLPEKIIEKNPEDNHQPIIEVDSSFAYQKVSKNILPKSFFIIISGGEEREKKYFKIISNNDSFDRIKIDFIADPNKLAPKGMLSIALYKKAYYLSSKNVAEDRPDEIFLVSDVDDFVKELCEIKPVCENENIHLIISNSCFEVWLYYAYRSDVPQFPIPLNIKTISWEFKRWVPKSIKGGINPIKAILEIKQNIINAKANYIEDANGIPELLSSNMFLLAERLLQLIEPELNELIEKNRIRENSFRKIANGK